MQNFTCRDESRSISAPLRREVRQAASFGCSSCGCPVIEYNHIIPFSDVKKHEYDNLIALCPTCHRKADKSGPWSTELVRQLKANPYNRDTTKDRFLVRDDEFIIQVGWFEFHKIGALISIGDEAMLECNRTEEGVLLVSGQFHDQNGKLVASITENEWQVYVDHAWDVEFISAKTLIVRSRPREVILRMRLTDNVLEVQQCFFIRDHIKFLLQGDDEKTNLEIQATNTFFRSKNEKVIVGPNGSIILR